MTLPENMWELADANTIQNEALRVLYVEVVQNLRRDAETHSGSTLEMLLAERIAWLYIWIRDQEARGQFNNRDYKDILNMWTGMVARLQSAFGGVDADAIRAGLMDNVGRVIRDTLSDLAPDIAGELREKFADAFEEATL